MGSQRRAISARSARWAAALAIVAVVSGSCSDSSSAHGAPASTSMPAGGQIDPREGAVRLMPIGDSITMGRSDRVGWRYPFQVDAERQGCAVDMVGSETKMADGPPSGDWASFDHDHESFGGRTTAESLAAVGPSATEWRPEIAAIHTGTNDVTRTNGVARADAFAEAETSLRELIGALREASPEITIVLAEIIPAGPARASETEVWNQRVTAVAAELNDLESPIVLIDVFTGFDYETMTVDEDNIHPNQLGAEFIARRFLNAVVEAGFCA